MYIQTTPLLKKNVRGGRTDLIRTLYACTLDEIRNLFRFIVWYNYRTFKT